MFASFAKWADYVHVGAQPQQTANTGPEEVKHQEGRQAGRWLEDRERKTERKESVRVGGGKHVYTPTHETWAGPAFPYLFSSLPPPPNRMTTPPQPQTMPSATFQQPPLRLQSSTSMFTRHLQARQWW